MMASATTLDTPAVIQTIPGHQIYFSAPSESATAATKSSATLEYGRFAEHFAKLKAISMNPHLWSHDDAPQAWSLASMYFVLKHLEAYGILPTKIVASAEGGVASCFVVGNKYADIECLNSEAILGVLSDKRNQPFVWEIEPNSRGITRAVERVREFIYGS
jgi:hypothetical protein